MAEWKEYRVGEIFNIQNGYAFKSGEFVENSDDTYEVLKIGHIEIGGGLRTDPKKTYVKRNSKYKKWVLEKNDIVMGMTDMKSNVVILGIPALVDKNDTYVLNQRVARLSLKDPHSFDIYFCYYQMLWNEFTTELRKTANSGVQVNLTTSGISTTILYVPNYELQRKIGRLLSSLDDKIENNRRINANLEAQAQALFKSWFVDFEPFNGKMPNDWRIGSLGEFAEISKTSVNPLKNPQTIFEHYSIPSYDDGMKPEMQQGEDIKSNKFVITNKMTLFSKLNPRIKRVWYVDKLSANAVCSTEFVPYKAKEESKSSFLYGLINSQGFYDFVMSKVNGATGSHQRFHPEESMKYKIAYNDEFLVKYCDFATPIINQILENRLESRRLASLRDALLPRLMSGELKVNDVNLASL